MSERDPKKAFLQECSAHLDDTLKSDGWRSVIRPALVERCTNIANKLARGKRLPEPEVRALQAEFLVLEAMVEAPTAFFMDGYEGAAERRFL